MVVENTSSKTNNELQIAYFQVTDLWKRLCEEHTKLWELTCEEYELMLSGKVDPLEQTIIKKEVINKYESEGAFLNQATRGRDAVHSRPIIGVAVIVVRDNRVLLGKRKGAHGAGGWQFPGGHLEYNESIENCAAREVWEETGLHIRNLRSGPYTNDIFREEKKHYVTLFVVADYEAGTAQVKEPEKCERWQWFKWGVFPEPLFLPTKHLLEQGFSPYV